MTFEHFLWIALCAAAALGAVWFQYGYRKPNHPRKYLLASLRFLGLMGVLLLLLPLQIEKRTTFTEKQRLFLLLDNTASVGREPGREQMEAARALFTEDPGLRERFEVSTYLFGRGLTRSDSLDFSENGTDITAALQALSAAQLDRNASMVLITDGIENQGRNLGSAGSSYLPVYPIVVGDTTRYRDVRIDRLNLNPYAFLGNQYPVEVLLSYRGQEPAEVSLLISDNGRPVHRQRIRMEAGRATERVEVLLKAGEVGFHQIGASVEPFQGERNRRNNRQSAGIEVIDESTRITLVSRHPHPDLGALRRSIEQNKQRQTRLATPSEAVALAADTDLWIFYQPDASFQSLYGLLEAGSTPLMTLAGPLTDWSFLNQVQGSFSLEDAGPGEDLLPDPIPGFPYFDSSGWEVSGYPPLKGNLGEYRVQGQNEWLLGQRVRGVPLNQPLMALIKGDSRREAVLFGSGIWKWRMRAFADQGSFDNFDTALGKVLLFLTAGQNTERLTLEYQRLYNGQQPAVIQARFYDEALRFDPGASLNLRLFDSTGTRQASYPIPLVKDYYEADISNLAPGTYSFEVEAAGTAFKKSGQFRLLAFDLENQQIQSNLQGLSRLARESGGALYFPSNMEDLKDSLLQADRFRPVQRSRRNVVSLIDYRWLLALIAAAFGAEWFIRKYNGLL
mgnify:CR=1 FL=1